MDNKTSNEMLKRFEEKMRTKEGQDWMAKFCADVKEQERQKRELVEKTDYIKWLEKFTKKYPDFSDQTWLYKQDEISKEDYENVSKISTFFSVISDFADKYYFPAYVCGSGSGLCYFLKYNDKIYDVGTIVGQGAVSYCYLTGFDKKLTAVGNSIVINFEEIANPSDAIRARAAIIENQLERIDDVFKILANNTKLNIPIEAIIDKAEKAIRELKKK